jgi:hypothetical protein
MSTKVNAKVTVLHTLEKGSPYRQLMSNRMAFSALTLASLIVTGYLKLNAKSVSASRSKGKPTVFKRMSGDSAWKTWKRRMDEEHTMLNAQGLNEVDARLSSAQGNAYHTDIMMVAEFVNAMKTGGTVKVDGKTYHFCISV